MRWPPDPTSDGLQHVYLASEDKIQVFDFSQDLCLAACFLEVFAFASWRLQLQETDASPSSDLSKPT